jgi:hypothetical protein
MSSFAPHEPEAFAGLQLEQPLDFQLRLGGAGKRNSHVNDGLPLRLFSFECGLDEHEARTSQNSVDQKEIVEPVRVYRRNPPPFHSNVLPAHGHGAAPGKNCTQELLPSSEFDSAPQPYGVRLFHFGNFATGAGVA